MDATHRSTQSSIDFLNDYIQHLLNLLDANANVNVNVKVYIFIFVEIIFCGAFRSILIWIICLSGGEHFLQRIFWLQAVRFTHI